MYMISVSRLSVRFPLWQNKSTFLQAKQIQSFRWWPNWVDCHGRDLHCSFYCYQSRVIVCVTLFSVSFANQRPCLESHWVSKNSFVKCWLRSPLDKIIHELITSQKYSSFPTYCGYSIGWRTPTRVDHFFFFKGKICTVVCNSHPGFGLFMPIDTAFRRDRFVINFESPFTLVSFALL